MNTHLSGRRSMQYNSYTERIHFEADAVVA